MIFYGPHSGADTPPLSRGERGILGNIVLKISDASILLAGEGGRRPDEVS